MIVQLMISILILVAALVIVVSPVVIPEGTLGIVYVLGSLSNTTLDAGAHVNLLFLVSQVSRVNIRPQTDQIQAVACGTSDGLSLVFENVDVGNTLFAPNVLHTIRTYGENYDQYLVKDKIRHQMQVICASMTSHEVFSTRFHEIDDLLQEFLIDFNARLKSGVNIDFVRFSKPMIPVSIRASYERLAEEQAMQKVEIEKQIRFRKEAHTMQLIAESERNISQSKLRMEFQMQLEESQNENQIKVARILADEEHSKVKNRIQEERATAEANALIMHTRALRELYNVSGYKEQLIAQHIATAIGSHAKFFFGTIPNFLPTSFYTNTSF